MPYKDPSARKARLKKRRDEEPGYREHVNAGHRKQYASLSSEERAARIAVTVLWQEKNPAKVKVIQRRAVLKRVYGITDAEYDAMLESQGGRCAICCRSRRGRRLAVDHCHATGAVRGLLCSSCNQTLGKMGDDPERLRAAAAYLEVVREPRSAAALPTPPTPWVPTPATPLRGEKNGNSKHADAVVLRVRELHDDGLTQAEISRLLGVPKATVSVIVRGKQRVGTAPIEMAST